MRRRKDNKGGEKDPEALARETLAGVLRGDHWQVTDDVFEEPTSPELIESPGLERGEEDKRAVRDFLRERYGDEPDDDQGPSGGGGPPRPVPNRPHDPVGGGTLIPDQLVDLRQQ